MRARLHARAEDGEGLRINIRQSVKISQGVLPVWVTNPAGTLPEQRIHQGAL